MTQDISRKKTLKYWRKALIGALLGGVCGYASGKFLAQDEAENFLGPMSGSEYVCFSLGLIYTLSALFVLLAILFPRLGVQLLNVQDSEELMETRKMLSMSAVGLLAMGFILMLIPAASPQGLLTHEVALAASAVFLLLAIYATWRLNYVMDEMMKSVSMEAGYVAFVLLLCVGGIWVSLAHLGYVLAPRPLDWLSLMTGFLWLASFIVVGKRGLLAPR